MAASGGLPKIRGELIGDRRDLSGLIKSKGKAIFARYVPTFITHRYDSSIE